MSSFERVYSVFGAFVSNDPNNSPPRLTFLLYYWFRLRGLSARQAEWRVRQWLIERKESTKAVPTQVRAEVGYYHCVCGQLLTQADTVCHACDRRQWVPFWVRRLGQASRDLIPGGYPATFIISVVLICGYLVQQKIEASTSGVSSWSLYVAGAAFPDLTLSGQMWRGIAYSWLHGGFFHIAMNFIVMLQILPLTERVYGSARVFLGWWLSALCGAVLPFILMPSEAPVVGASGANFGIMGMTMIFGHRLGTAGGRQLRDSMIMWALLSTVLGFSMGARIAHGAHFGGLAAGILVAVTLPPAKTVTQKRLTVPALVMGVGIMLWGILGNIAWMTSDYRPPDALGVEGQARYYYLQTLVQGDVSVLGSDGERFLDKVRAFRNSPLPAIEKSLLQQKPIILEALNDAQRLVLERRLYEILNTPD